MRKTALAACALLAGVAIATGSPALSQAVPRVEVKLTPLLTDGALAKIQVAQTLDGLAGNPEQVLVSVPARVALTKGQEYTAETVRFRDEAGPLPVQMRVVEAPPGVPLQMRNFTPSRSTKGKITIQYEAMVTPALSPREPGPSYGLRGAEGGVGGAYFSFLLLPLQTPKIDLRLSIEQARGRASLPLTKARLFALRLRRWRSTPRSF